MKPEDIDKMAAQLTSIEQQQKAAHDEIKKSGEAAHAEIKNLGEVTAATKAAADDALLKYGDLAKKHGEIAGRLTEVEQTMAQKSKERDDGDVKTLGSIVVDNDKVKAFNSSTRGSVRVQVNRADIMNVTGTVGSNTSTANSLVGALRVPGIVTPPERKL